TCQVKLVGRLSGRGIGQTSLRSFRPIPSPLAPAGASMQPGSARGVLVPNRKTCQVRLVASLLYDRLDLASRTLIPPRNRSDLPAVVQPNSLPAGAGMQPGSARGVLVPNRKTCQVRFVASRNMIGWTWQVGR